MFYRNLTDFPENYGYLNARLRAHFSDFLEKEDYRRLAEKSLEGIEIFLLDTKYGKSFRKGLVEEPLSTHRRIEIALADAVASSLNHARKMAMGEPGDLLGVLLSGADIHNGRLLLRFFFTGAKYAGAPMWHGYGMLPVKFYSQLWNMRSIAHVIDRCLAFPAPLARPLASAFSELGKNGPLPESERVLLQGILDFFEGTIKRYRSKNAAVAREFLGRSIDIWNLNIWTRVFSGILPAEKGSDLYIEKGAYLSIDRLKGSVDLEQLFRGLPWEEIISGAQSKKIEMIASRAVKNFWLWQISLKRKDPLGIEVAIGFCAQQLVEWQNLNALVVGIEMGLPVDSIMDKMII